MAGIDWRAIHGESISEGERRLPCLTVQHTHTVSMSSTQSAVNSKQVRSKTHAIKPGLTGERGVVNTGVLVSLGEI